MENFFTEIFFDQNYGISSISHQINQANCYNAKQNFSLNWAWHNSSPSLLSLNLSQCLYSLVFYIFPLSLSLYHIHHENAQWPFSVRKSLETFLSTRIRYLWAMPCRAWGLTSYTALTVSSSQRKSQLSNTLFIWYTFCITYSKLHSPQHSE